MRKSADKKIAPLLILNALLAVVLLLLALLHPVDPVRDFRIPRRTGDSVFYVYEEREFRQSFTLDGDADTFEVQLTNVRNDWYGTFRVLLEDGTGTTVQSWETDKLDLKSGLQGKDGWIAWHVDGGLRAGEQYTIVITAPDLNETEAVAVQVREAEAGETRCVMNGNETEYVSSFAVCIARTNWFYIGAVAVLFATANYWWLNRKKDLRKTAFWILLGTGLIMMLIMVPGSQPDEEYHYCSAYKLSNVWMGKDNVNEVEPGMYAGFRQHYNKNASFLKLMNELGSGEGKIEEEKYFLERSDELTAPAGYVAPALGITVVRLLGGNEAQAYTVARLFTMLSYVLLCGIAIRLIPKNRELMLLICIIPMAVHMAASTSRDVFVNGMTLVFTAYIFKLIYERKPFTWGQTLACTGMLALFGPVKIFHCMLGLLALLIPKEQFRSRKDKAAKIAFMLLAVGAVLFLSQAREIWKALTHSNYAGRTDYYHIDFIWNHPLHYLKLLLGSIEADFWFYLKESMGTRLAGLTVHVAEYLNVAFLALLLVAAVRQTQERDFLQRKQKIWLLVFCALGYAVMAAGFSFKDTIYGSTEIAGVQGRYLLSFAPALYALSNRKITAKIEGHTLIYPVWFIYGGFIAYVMSQIYV